MTDVAVSLPLLRPSDEERDLIERLLERLRFYQTTNLTKAAYYEGEQRVEMLNISIPPELQSLETVVGWPGTTVDVLEERLDWYGWTSEEGDLGLDEVYRDNQLAVESSTLHTDVLLFGTSFAAVGSGWDGEPHPLVTFHPPTNMTGLHSARTRRLEAALSVVVENGIETEVTLYRPDETTYFARGGSGWTVTERDRHNLGRVPVVQFVNRRRGSRLGGRSEISRAVRYYTDAAVRTMLGMEVNREFYSAPQRYALGVDESSFVGADGNVRTGWETIMGRVWAIGRDEDGELPSVGQFTPNSPAPYLEQVKGLAQLLAAEAAIPPSYLGFQTDNPASADAIQRSEARLVKRAERRQSGFGLSWLEVGRLALLVRDGSVPDGFSLVSSKWRDAATPTRSAAADEAAKLVGAQILPADSQVTFDRIGLTPAEQRQVMADRRRDTGRAVIEAALNRAQS